MTTIQDQAQRQQALNPTQSFIVQAPAGSGKTELLTQRFLVLLSVVKNPEEILAITFTKKAAAEMRMRIINALKTAAHNPEPESAHAKQTWQLAKNALRQDEVQQWQLLKNPNRLRIQTIDSFNSSITRHLPILAHFGAPPDITDNPSLLYQQAVDDFLEHLEAGDDWSEAIELLLLHLDNNVENLKKLLIILLGKRDQWLPHIIPHVGDNVFRGELEAYLASISVEIIRHIKKSLPVQHTQGLLLLARFAADNLGQRGKNSTVSNCLDYVALPEVNLSAKPFWLGVAELLLTEKSEWRKTFNITMGFPAPDSTKNPQEKKLYATMKESAKKLIAELSAHPHLRKSLQELRQAPDNKYEEQQWNVLAALQQALRLVVARLKIVFQIHNKIDFIENAQAALLALGNEDAPTDLALALDYKIQHMLIDEFQDTSNSQYRLLRKLILGWQHNDGKTLFIVGDPMQSIYRFREAEVGLFIRACQSGIGHVKLHPITLSVNFRSTPGIVNWVNDHFKNVLAPEEDIATGAISYSASIAHKEAEDTQAVTLHPFLNPPATAQAQKIITLIEQAKQQNPQGSIAILTRSRPHLKEIIADLKAANLAYRAIKIDPLASRPIIHDLLALTRALINIADRVAWLALLRAPWCGLTLSDLVIIAGGRQEALIWSQLQNPAVLAALSVDGQQRVQRLLPILQANLTERRRHSLAIWVENTWLTLGGPACVDETDLEDVQAFLKLLGEYDQGSDLLNLENFIAAMDKLYAAPNHQADGTLQIMTIHTAKGLEFDTVILPHLERKPQKDKKQLLLWMETARKDHDAAIMLAPIHDSSKKTDPIYKYICNQQTIKSNHENGRLLYVAATRAKKHLHLLMNLKAKHQHLIDEIKPVSNSLLGKLWPAIYSDVKKLLATQEVKNNEDVIAARPPKLIKRLTLNWINPILEKVMPTHIAKQNPYREYTWQRHTQRHVGTVVHKVLQQLARNGIDLWHDHAPAQRQIYLQKHLAQLGVTRDDFPTAIKTIETAIQNTLNDPKGLWILSPHAEAQAEFALTTEVDGKIKSIIIDRTFVTADGTRWIIDYKTSHHLDDELEVFLQTEQQKYQEQLAFYQKALSHIDTRPIHLGLYFPLIPAWREWTLENILLDIAFTP